MAQSNMESRKRRRLLKNAVALLAVCAAGFVMLRAFEHNQVYQPGRELAATGSELGRPFEDGSLRTADGVELHGWFFPADTNSLRAHIAILICHGNAGNISHRLDLCDALLRRGAAVFVFDYRGYGRSHGRPGEAGTYRDAQAAHAWLRQKGFPGEHIIAFGESLGGAVACELALREKVGGIVLQSTFTSVPDLGAELFPWLPVRWLSTIKYDTRAKLPRLKVPVLVMHSRRDEIVGFPHGERNFAAANEPKWFCELNGGHNDATWEQPEFTAAIEVLLKAIETASLKGAESPSHPK